MPLRSIRIESRDSSRFTDGMLAIKAELLVPSDFPAEVLAAAEHAAANPIMPELDRTDLPLVTIDPLGARDLDQALHLERQGGGYRVFYAIADIAAFVTPGGALDLEAHRRGQTLYAPDHRIPLHPPVLSEGAASLLPDQERPALLWTIDLDNRGEGTRVDVQRARVKSRAQLDYVGVQTALDGAECDEALLLLREVGELRSARERERGGVNLGLPEQQVSAADGSWSLRYRQLSPVEEWNAQISLLTGMGAAQIMLYGETGIVRTLPAATEADLARLRRTAAALHLDWHPDLDYPDFVRSIDPNSAAGAAMLNACATLLRGAGYVAFDGGVPEHIEHAAIANEYAHVTAPLRRLVDRYAGEVAVSLCADVDIPDWVRAKLRDLPKEMEASDRLAHRFERAVLELVEAVVLAGREGETFAGVMTDVDDRDPSKGLVMLQELAVEARVASGNGTLPLGDQVQVSLVEADPVARRVRFDLA